MGAHAKYSKRLSIFAFMLVAIVFALGFRLVDFQVVRAEEIQEKSLDRREVTRTLTALRGNIVDSTGQILAKTVFRYDINAAPKNVGPVRINQDGVIIERSSPAYRAHDNNRSRAASSSMTLGRCLSCRLPDRISSPMTIRPMFMSDALRGSWRNRG